MIFKNFYSKIKRPKQSESQNLQTILDSIMEPLDVPTYQDRSGRPRCLSDEQIIQIMLLKSEGISNSEIARRMKVSEGTIRNRLREVTLRNTLNTTN